MLPEPVTEEPPPSTPDEAPVIQITSPAQTLVPASQSADGNCEITIGLPEVEDPSGAALTARVFLNYNNPYLCGAEDPNCPATYEPLALENSGAGVASSFDFPLTAANVDNPMILELLPLTIDLSDYEDQLVPPSETTAAVLNYVEVVVSDGFTDANGDFIDPASGKSAIKTSWYIDLSACTELTL